MLFSNLNIGFNSSATLVDDNTYEITGDISAVVTDIEDEYDSFKKTVRIDRIKVIYNHDGLFRETIKADGNPDAMRIFRDTEVHANDNSTEFNLAECMEGCETVVALHHDNALNIYATFMY